MSLLSRFILIVLAVGLVFVGWWFVEKTETSKREVQERYLSFLANSISEPTQTIDQLISLVENKEISGDELILLFELTLESSNHSVEPFLPVLEAKLRGTFTSIDWEIISACALYRQGEFEAAKLKLKQISKDHPANRRANYEYQKINWLIGGIDDRVGAKRALFDLTQVDDRWSYKALRVLGFLLPRPGVTKEDLIKALEMLCAHNLVTSKDLLNASELLIQLDDERTFEQVFQQLLNENKDSLEKRDLGYWLIQLAQPEKALAMISTEESLADEDFFFIRLQALLETNQIAVAQNLYDQATYLSESKKLQANAYLQLSEENAEVLNKFFEDAKKLNQAPILLDVSRLALLQGSGPVAYRAFQDAWSIDPVKFNVSQANQYLQLSLNARNTKEAYQITKKIFHRYPEKFGNANNHCYLSLLLGDDPKIQAKEAVRITTAFPSSPTFLSTLALAELLNGKPKEALRAMNQRGPVPLNHGEKALLACILESVGNKKDAQKLADELEENRMLPEEWSMLKKYRLVES